jgi:hypothetical protein
MEAHEHPNAFPDTYSSTAQRASAVHAACGSAKPKATTDNTKHAELTPALRHYLNFPRRLKWLHEFNPPRWRRIARTWHMQKAEFDLAKRR